MLDRGLTHLFQSPSLPVPCSAFMWVGFLLWQPFSLEKHAAAHWKETSSPIVPVQVPRLCVIGLLVLCLPLSNILIGQLQSHVHPGTRKMGLGWPPKGKCSHYIQKGEWMCSQANHRCPPPPAKLNCSQTTLGGHLWRRALFTLPKCLSLVWPTRTHPSGLSSYGWPPLSLNLSSLG